MSCLTGANPAFSLSHATRQGTYTDQIGQEECKTCSAGAWTEITMPGLRWEALGSLLPRTGTQYDNWQLSAKLQSQVDFTEADLSGMNIVPWSLSYDMYVLVEARSDGTPTTQYLRPVTIGATRCRACPEGTASSATGCLACDKVNFDLLCPRA